MASISCPEVWLFAIEPAAMATGPVTLPPPLRPAPAPCVPMKVYP